MQTINVFKLKCLLRSISVTGPVGHPASWVQQYEGPIRDVLLNTKNYMQGTAYKLK
jgi:hypothetical protein